MSVNERIAKWAGAECDELECPFRDDHCDLSASYDTDITLWHGEDGLLAKVASEDDDFVKAFMDNVLDALEIGESFETTEEADTMFYDGILWPTYRVLLKLIRPTAAQLAAALDEVIS